MREILFRGKTESGDWEYGYYVFTPKSTGTFGQTISQADYDRHYILTMKYNFAKEINPSTVGQYIGANDCTGTKIFEGDIVEYKEDIGCITYINEEAMFVVEFDTCFTDFNHLYSTQLEIIGNIHDNPELLKGETNA
jgi:uncharacterized phage protein (TIGR01671 family)